MTRASASSLRIIVTGLIAQYPLGGVTWDYLHYVVGLAQLGHDVYYLEDTGQWPYNPEEQGISKGHEFNVHYLAQVMSRFGLQDHWMYRFPWQSRWFGIDDRRREEIISSADLIINVSGTLARPEQYRRGARLVYIDSDPVFTQLKMARGQTDFRRLVDMHDVHFTFGESIAHGEAPAVPVTGHQWLPTRQPVVIEEWSADGVSQRDAFTTIMNWTSYKPVEYEGQEYGQKDVEFMRFADVPRSTGVPMEVAMAAGKLRRPPRQLLARKGWAIVDPDDVCSDLDGYRAYIQASRAEWSVAKNGYVIGRPGWFSCRSACYLAAGRPVVVQETGFTDILPTGEGLHAFSTPDEAVDAVAEVVADYPRHSRAARELALAYFDSKIVLTRLLETALRSTPSDVMETV